MNQYEYYVYFLTNKHKSVLYVGVTNNLVRRLNEHLNRHNPNCFTARYRCWNLVYFESYQYINDAIAREKEIKGWSRSKKNALIECENPNWDFWNDDILGLQNPKE